MMNLYPLVIIAVVLFIVLNLAGGLIWVERRLLAVVAGSIRPKPCRTFRLRTGACGFSEAFYQRRLDSALCR